MERIKRGNLRAVEINKAKKRKLKYITIAILIAVLLPLMKLNKIQFYQLMIALN